MPVTESASIRARGYLLGLILALTSPWNVDFWFAAVGGQSAAQKHATFLSSLILAAAPGIFARPAWQIGTQIASALVMLFFAVRLVWLWQ